jgi:hypothetical protein
MDKESLERAREILVVALNSDPKIHVVDKVELMMNVDKFLDPNEYENNIKVLRKERNQYGRSINR